MPTFAIRPDEIEFPGLGRLFYAHKTTDPWGIRIQLPLGMMKLNFQDWEDCFMLIRLPILGGFV
jgi:hypothetical protein